MADVASNNFQADGNLSRAQAVGKHMRDAGCYAPDLKEVDAAARELLEKYSHIEPEKVVEHVLAMREKAWNVFPYPCIGQFRFLDFSVASSACYSKVLDRVKQGEQLLDLGCCFGQDIRKLIYDGAPPENLWGAELRQEYIDLGYALFQDSATLKSKFLIANIFDPQSSLETLHGKIDIVHAASFLHLFNWDDQVKVCMQIVKILKPQAGSLIFGRQMGNLVPRELPHIAGRDGNKWWHNPESFQKMWDEICEKTGTKWTVNVKFGNTGKNAPEVKAFERKWMDENARRMTFEIERI